MNGTTTKNEVCFVCMQAGIKNEILGLIKANGSYAI